MLKFWVVPFWVLGGFFKKSMTIDIIKNYSAGCHRKPIFSANPIPLQVFELLNASLEVEEDSYT